MAEINTVVGRNALLSIYRITPEPCLRQEGCFVFGGGANVFGTGGARQLTEQPQISLLVPTLRLRVLKHFLFVCL